MKRIALTMAALVAFEGSASAATIQANRAPAIIACLKSPHKEDAKAHACLDNVATMTPEQNGTCFNQMHAFDDANAERCISKSEVEKLAIAEYLLSWASGPKGICGGHDSGDGDIGKILDASKGDPWQQAETRLKTVADKKVIV